MPETRQKNLYAREAQHQQGSEVFYIRRMDKVITCFHHLPFKAKVLGFAVILIT